MSLSRLALLHERFIGAVVFDGLWLRLRLGGEGMLDVKRRKRGDFEQLLRRGTLVGVLRETLRHEVHELLGPLGLVR